MSSANAPRLDLGRVISRTFANVRQRWAVLGLFLAVYYAIIWTYEAAGPFRDKAGVHDWRLGIGLAIYLALSSLMWFRDTAVVAVALASDPTAGLFRTMARDAKAALRAFPTTLPFFILMNLPDLTEAFWRRWAPLGHLSVGKMVSLIEMTSLVELVFALAVAGAWGVAVPIAVAERMGLISSMNHAWRLLSGNRWRFIAIYFVAMIAIAVPTLLAVVLTFALPLSMRIGGGTRVVSAAAGALGGAATAVWWAMVSVAYLELRRARDGVDVGDVVEVFA